MQNFATAKFSSGYANGHSTEGAATLTIDDFLPFPLTPMEAPEEVQRNRDEFNDWKMAMKAEAARIDAEVASRKS